MRVHRLRSADRSHRLFHSRLRIQLFLWLSGSILGLIGISVALRPSTSVAATRIFAWNSAAPAPIERFESQGLAVNGKLYLFGGFYNAEIQATTRADVFDPKTNSWVRIADMPEAITHAGQASDGERIYLVGGYVGDSPGPSTAHVWTYTLASDTWSAGPALPAARGGGGAVLVGRSLHFIGGATRGTTVESAVDQGDHFVLNLDGGTSWTQAAPLPNPRNHIAVVALNGKIYVIGGQHRNNEGTENQEQVDVYDPATDSWTRAANLPRPHSHTSASTFIMANRIISVGGSGNDGRNGTPLASVLLYDPQTDVWIALPPLPEGRKTPVADAIDEQIVVATGNGGGPTATTWIGTLQDSWEQGAELPVALGEVAGGIIGNKLFLVGNGDAATLSYNLSTNSWEDAAAVSQRPFVGDHHAADVFNGKLYLFGGLGIGAGKVQIYDPTTNRWTLGVDMPFAAGSSVSAVINGEVYVAGGIVGEATTAQMAKYNPTTDAWTRLAPLPQGRNHAAAATDGSKFYLFGGRGPGSGDGNVVANGFDTVQIYDPATNSWVSSLDAASTLAPLPQARGGMGKAVFVDGEFYVIGGETLTGNGATGDKVYDRVDIYDPQANRWRQGSSLPTARHGVFPLQIAGRIYVAGGGVEAGQSSSTLLEVYNAGKFEAAPEPESRRAYIPFVAKDRDSSLGSGNLATTVRPGVPAAATAAATSSAWLANFRLHLPLVASLGASPGGTATATRTSTVTPSRTPSTSPTQPSTATTTATVSTPGLPRPTDTPTATSTPTGTPQAGITAITWSTVASHPKNMSEGQSVVANGKLYSFGGFAPCCIPTRHVYVYDPAINSWTRLADMPKALTHAGITTDEQFIYYASGYIEKTNASGEPSGQIFGTKQVWRYDIANNTYSPMPDLPVELAGGVLVLLGRNLHYIGGSNMARTLDVGDHYVLSLDGGTSWTTAASMPNPRHHMGGVVLDGKIYTVGGQHKHDGELVPQRSVHRYDPVSDSWQELASLPFGRNHITGATFLVRGQIMVVAGQTTHRNPIDDVTVYDPQTNSWTDVTPLPAPRFSGVAGVINGVIYYATGGAATTYKGVLAPSGGRVLGRQRPLPTPLLLPSDKQFRDSNAIGLYLCQ